MELLFLSFSFNFLLCMVWESISFRQRRINSIWMFVTSYNSRSVLESVVLLFSLMMRYSASFCRVAIFMSVSFNFFYVNVVENCIVSPKKSIFEMVPRGVL